jgi:mannan endo-1,4-beta-mannosidase
MLVLCLSFVSSVYEAEDAKLDGVTVARSQAGYSGTGYVDMHDAGSITWTVTLTSAGFYDLIIGFAGTYGAKKQNLAVNGASLGEVSFPETKSFETIVGAQKLSLKAGANTIQISASWGWELFDYIDLKPYVDTPFNISASPVTAGSNKAAIALYTYLKNNFQKATVSGTMTLQGNTADAFKENNWVHDNTGHYPAIVGLDFLHQVGKNSEWYTGNAQLKKSVVNDAVNYWNRGGIPTVSWHWRDPSHETDAFYSPSSQNTPTQFDASKAVVAGTPENAAVLRDLDIIAAELLDLQSRGVAILWRPLHEASGGWFWWGYKGADAAKKLYRLEYDRFVNHHGLKNLIWVWTTDSAANALDWYPGADVVDIVGMDIYPPKGDHNAQSVAFEKVKSIYGASKIIALGECGAIPAAAEMVASGATWSYFLPWFGDYVIPTGSNDYNSLEFWKAQMAHSFVIGLDRMPGWK